MAKDKLTKAQVGTTIPKPVAPKSMLDEGFMESRYGGYRQSQGLPGAQAGNVINRSFESSEPRLSALDRLSQMLNAVPSGKGIGPKTRTADQYVGSDRYDYFSADPTWDNEDAAAQGQSFGSKMVNGVAKGISLTGTTLLQNTVGLVNGIVQATKDGRLASFYDNDFNNALDEFNKGLEDSMPNYYTAVERDANWYSPKYWATGNFLWDGVVKNMGFAAGTYLSAGVYTSALKGLPLASKLFSTGKAAETIAATEAGLAGGSGSASIYGELKGLSDTFLKTANGYNTLNKGQRILVAGLSTTGEAGFEALHNGNEFRQELISQYENEFGTVPTQEALDEINRVTDAASNRAMVANMALLTATNYIQLPKIFQSSYNSEKTLLNGLGRELGDVTIDAAGTASKTRVGRLGRVVNVIRKPYFFSYSEALEESSQFGIGAATKDYYRRGYDGEATSWISSIGAGLEAMTSDEGAKNALIGGLSGSIMMNVAPSVRSLLSKDYKTQNQRKKANTESFIAQVNKSNLGAAINEMEFELSNFTKETGESVNRGTVIQKLREQALKNGEIFDSKNLEADYIINYLTPRIKYGRFDLVKSEIEEYRTLGSTDVGYDQLVKEGKALSTDTREAFLARINRFETVAENSYSLYQSLNLRYGSEFRKNDLGEIIEDKNGNPILKYPPSVMNQMLYTSLKTEDFDQRILNLTGKLSAAGINVDGVLQSVVNGDFKAYNEAVVQLKDSDIIGETKDQLGSYLDDIADAAAQRQNFIKTYDDIKENPDSYVSEPVIVKDDVAEEDKETIIVKTERGQTEVDLETEYFVGNSVILDDEKLSELNKIGQFSIKGYNEDGTIKIVDSNTGQERDISSDTLEKFKVGRVSSLANNATAKFFYDHRNEVFKLNRGKNFGGYVPGRLEYQTVSKTEGKIYFVYKTNGGKIKKKQVDGSFFVAKKGFNNARITPVGSVQSQAQKKSSEKFKSPAEIQKQRRTLKENREARLEVLTQLGEESKENIVELNKQIEKAASDLVKVKEDLANIRKMKKTGETGPRIKLNFSKATKSFTRTINKLTQMRKDLNKTIKLAEIERDELAADISYFEQYTTEISEAPEDSGDFLKELKDQVKLLAESGKNLAKIIRAAKKMGTTLRQVTKKAASLFRKALKSTYIIDETYAQSLNNLLDDVAAGENLDVTWPALKQEIVNFQLTNDISKDVNLNESDIVKTQDELAKLDNDINELRTEYRARKIILDRFQSIMNEYNAKKAAEQKVANDQKLLDRILATGIKAPALKEYEGAYNPDSKKATNIVPVATIPNDDEGEDYQVRANTFGANLNSLENRDDIRGVYVTSEIEDQLLPGVIDKMLSGGKEELSEEQKEKFKKTMIVMVMVNTDNEVVDVNGQPIPQEESLLDNAIYQAMPEASLTNSKGSMFRENTGDAVETEVRSQYSQFRESVLAQTAIGVPQEIEASFGTPEYVTDSAGNKVYTTITSVQDAGLVEEVDLETKLLINVPTSTGPVALGTTSYDAPLGRVFLRLKNAYVPLKNRRHTKKEATTIYEVILQLSKNIVAGEGVESDSSIDLLNFLKRVTYWGIPTNNAGERKEPGRNSVFFQRTDPGAGGGLAFSKLQLVIGRSPESRFDFAPTDLEMSKDVIISLLENTYNNINAYDSILNNLDAEFQQIVGIENGEVQDVIWDNYQTYLLSNTNPDGSKRPDFELPLHTMIKPKEEGEVNRKNIYFFSTTGQDNYTIKNPVSQGQTDNIIKDGKVIAPAKQKKATQSNDGYVLDGQADEVYTSAQGSKINFRFDGRATKPSWDQIGILPGADLDATIEKIEESGGDPESTIKQYIFATLEQVLAKRKKADAFNENLITDDVFDNAGAGASLFSDTPVVEKTAPVAPTQETSEVTITEDVPTEGGLNFQDDIDDAISDMNEEHFREVLDGELSLFKTENWNEVGTWMSKNLPQVPLNIVKNIIQAGGGRTAWGMYKNKAIYVYENAEVGTTYHEAFEAVFNGMLSTEDKVKLRKEFNSRKGTFTDRPSGQTVKFSEATGQQIKEQLAEEFRDYVQDGVKPKGLFARMFKKLKDLIEKWFMNPSSDTFTKELFSRIDKGFYANKPLYKMQPYTLGFSRPIEVDIALANVQEEDGSYYYRDAFDTEPEYRLIALDDQQMYDTLQEMTYQLVKETLKNDGDLFNLSVIKGKDSEIYNQILKDVIRVAKQKGNVATKYLNESKSAAAKGEKEFQWGSKMRNVLTPVEMSALNVSIIQSRKLSKDIIATWPLLIDKHKEYLQSFNVSFDENSQEQLEDDDRIRESNKFDASKIDSLNAAGSTLRLLLATLQIKNSQGKPIISSINGSVLQPMGKTYITLMTKLHESRSPDDMMAKLKKLAQEDSTYAALYNRITGDDPVTSGVSFDNTSQEQSRLVTAMWRTFHKMAPEFLNTFIFEDGVTVGPAAYSSAADQLKRNYLNGISAMSKSGNGFFTYSKKDGKYFPKVQTLANVALNTPTAMSNFLKKLGVSFSDADIRKLYRLGKKEELQNITEKIKDSLSTLKSVTTFSRSTLDIVKRLQQLAFLQTLATNPDYDSTFYNVNGEMQQSYFGGNVASDLHTVLKNVKKKEDLAGTPFEYLLTDVFSQGSNLMSRMFARNGTKKANVSNLFKPGIAGGIVYDGKKANKSSANLTSRQRFIQELNLNMKGVFMNLVPGDASLEHTLDIGKAVLPEQLSPKGFERVVSNIFKPYLLSEINLSRDDRYIPEIKYEEDATEFDKRKTTDLRFFKGILGEKLHNVIVNQEGSPEDVYDLHITEIEAAVKAYILRAVSRNQTQLSKYGMIQVGGTVQALYSIPEIQMGKNLKVGEFQRELTAMSINYIVANIEMHKLLYSDPYQYTDELKRTKSFNSPRQTLVNNSPLFQAQQNNVWNTGYDKGDIGYYDLTKDHFVTATHNDVIGAIDLPGYKPYEETDGASIATFSAYRTLRIQGDNWNAAEEKQYRYDIAWEKRDKSIKRNPEEETLLKEGNPSVKSAYPDQKPIVSGSKLDKSGNNSSFNDVVLDKNSIYPLSYRVMKELKAENGVRLYNKMQEEGIDYIAFKSARKVGAQSLHSTYNKDGSFNTDEYVDKVLVPFSIMGIQSEVPSKEVNTVTMGSQTTKLITLDMFDNGVPIDYKHFTGEGELSRLDQWENLEESERLKESGIYKEALNNTDILNALTEDAYERVLRRLGISEIDGAYEIVDISEAAKTLRSELFKRHTDDNISIALQEFETKGVALEITPAYAQVRNILYSIANKELVKKKISGGLKTQIPSTLFEGTRAKFNEKLNGYTSDVLKFYEDKDGKRVMEIAVGRWFKSNLSDEKLLEYLNKDENKSILEGLAFRIPTQAQSSIDVIRVGMILPKEFGDNVVVPSAIVAKVGSDFDIDKLSIYLKNVFYVNGKLKEVPFLGTGKDAKRGIADIFDSGKLFTSAQKKQLDGLGQLKSWEIEGLINSEESDQGFGDLLAQLGVVEQEDSLVTFINELAEIGVRETIINRLYKQSLENGYIDSSRKLVSHPQNFERLIRPNSADYLKDLAKRVVLKTKGQPFNYTKVDNMLDNRFMLSLRQAFVTGKKAIGIDALSQTGLSLNQKSAVTVDIERRESLKPEDKAWIGDGRIAFENYNKYKGKASLSGVYNSSGQLISNINSQLMDGHVDISKGPWVMELGATPQVAPVILFLNNIGVPIDQIVFFVNQPIIKTYIGTLENAGQTWLYNPNIYNETIDQYGGSVRTETESKDFVIPNADTLEQTMSSSSKIKSNQPEYLKEFLKYARMAGQYYTYSNGTNFDTAILNDHFLVFKKQIQYKQAQESLISGAESRLADTFLGTLGDRLGVTGNKGNTRDALSLFLLSDRGNVRNVLEDVLLPYVNLPNKQFIKTARKAVNSLIDWGMQTRGLNTQLEKILLSDNGTAAQVASLINEIKTSKKGSPYYSMRDNLVVNSLQAMPARKAGVLPNNLKINSLGTKAYDVNSVIFSFRTLKKFLEGMDQAGLYDDIVKLSVLQSGLAKSPISFTSFLPYEDVAKIYQYTLPVLDNMPNLQDFVTLNMFERNSWQDPDIVSSKSLYMITPQNSNARQASYPSIADWARPASVNQAYNKKQIPLTVTQDVRYFKPGDVIVSFNWTDLAIGRTKRNEMRKEGDYSYIKKGLFKIVTDEFEMPIVYFNEKTDQQYYIYKAINGLGDGYKAQEYYGAASKSKIDNGLIAPIEMSDAVITEAWQGELDIITTIEEVGEIYSIDKNGDFRLADNQVYPAEEVTAELLEEIGYSKQSANNILTQKCRG